MLQIIFKINYSGQPKPKKNVRISLLRQVISLLPSSLVDWFGRKVIPPTGDFTLWGAKGWWRWEKTKVPVGNDTQNESSLQFIYSTCHSLDQFYWLWSYVILRWSKVTKCILLLLGLCVCIYISSTCVRERNYFNMYVHVLICALLAYPLWINKVVSYCIETWQLCEQVSYTDSFMRYLIMQLL